MKTIRNLVSVMALLAITAGAAAEVAPTVRDSKETPVSQPYFSMKGERMFVSLLNVDLTDIRIKVVDNVGRVLYREVIKDELVIEKAFNFERAYEGEYRVVVERNGERFIKRIRV